MKAMPLIAVILAALLAAAAGRGVLLHGTVYDLSLDPVEGAVVEVNTTPGQRFLSTDGGYSFDLQPGSYFLTAKKLSGDEAVSSAEESILIEGDGNFVLDLILYPEVISEEDLLAPGELDEVERDFSTPFPRLAIIAGAASATLAALAFMLLLLGRAGRRLSSVEMVLASLRHRKHTPAPPETGQESPSRPAEPPPEPSPGLSPELSKLCSIISAAGGRMTQRDLRKELPYSEAKVSLMVAELERRGILKKFKKGRGNIIILAKEHPGGEHR